MVEKSLDLEHHFFLVHRLDRGTSGVVVFAKNRESARSLAKTFKKREAEKTYLALVSGSITPYSGKIISGQPFFSSDNEVYYKILGDLETITYYKVLDYKNGVSFVLVQPRTGRNHQIRIHFAYGLRTPIIGDSKHGGKIYKKIKNSFLCLHASSLTFSLEKKQYSFCAPLPSYMEKIIMEKGLSW